MGPGSGERSYRIPLEYPCREEFALYRSRILAGLLVLVLTVGCKAQGSPSAPDPALNHRIEILVRSQYDLPPDVNITFGARTPSQFTGYETLPVTIARGSRSQTINFLITTDSTKLVHFDTLDLTKDPADAIPIAGRPVRGNAAAKVTVVNYDDLECPFCARMHQELFPETIEHYKGMVRFVYKDDPLVEIHPWAMHAAVDANCLAAQNGDVYWNYVDYIHAHGEEVAGEKRDPARSNATLDRIARQMATLGKLDENRLNECLVKQDESQVRESMQLAEKLGIEGTPAIYVNGERVNGGAVPRDELWLVIDRALRAAGEEPPALPAASAPASGSAGAASAGK